MKVETNLKAGDFLSQLSSGLEQVGSYISHVISEADAQATQLTGDLIYTSSAIVDCVNAKIQQRYR